MAAYGYSTNYQKQCTGGTKTTAPFCYTTSYPGFILQGNRGGVKRKKPSNLRANTTGYSSFEWKQVQIAPISDEFGNLVPYGVFGMPGAASTSSADLTNVINRAATGILVNIKNQKWNLATTFAEFGETLRFVAHVAERLKYAYLAFRKGDVLALSHLYREYEARGGRRLKPWKRFRRDYLAFRYAVRPMIQDLDGLLLEIATSNAQPSVRSVRSNQSCTTSKTYKTANPSGWIGELIEVQYTKLDYCRAVDFTVDPMIANWKRLGGTNLVAVLYEVTPASFIFDWFCPLGKYIGLMDADIGVSVTSSYSVQKTSSRSISNFRNGAALYNGWTYGRTVGLGLPGIPKPQIAPSLDALKCLDLVLILSQLRGR